MRENMSELALTRSAKLLEELIRKREELGMTQPELAEQLGIHRLAISHAERRGDGGNLESLIDRADAIGLEVVLTPKVVGQAGEEL
jgi:transcriptional regulator with XRE-family HTH domain